MPVTEVINTKDSFSFLNYSETDLFRPDSIEDVNEDRNGNMVPHSPKPSATL